jgi:uncharacterized protein YprB with RNaseH-like and TPR domain
LLALPGPVVEGFHRDTVAAVVAELSPDCVVAAPPREHSVRAALSRGSDVPVLSPTRPGPVETVPAGDDSVLVVAAPARRRSVEGIRSGAAGDPAERDPPASEPAHRVCLTAEVALDVDPYERETSITGIETYADRLPAAWLTPRTTHCSTALRAGYRATAVVDGAEITLVGIGTTEASLGVGSSGDTGRGTLVELFPNGCSNCEDVDPAAFGVRGIRGVGEKRASVLREAGFGTPADVADAEPYELNDLSGFGGATTRRIRATAEARATGTVVATGDDPLPRGEPVFIDIETDGLEPSTAWLVGVLDGGPEDGHYMPFTERAPGDGSHLEAFLAWAEANAANRPLVAWNGYSFDFPVIRDLVRKHCPERLPVWDDAYQFDPLWWARDKNGGNAALPGRSNELETVAEALGWEPQTTGIDGSVVAKRYSAYRREWLADGADGPVDEPDWDRLEAYCEDDVRALATIYEALNDASRREPGADTRSGTETSTQGALSDFS